MYPCTHPPFYLYLSTHLPIYYHLHLLIYPCIILPSVHPALPLSHPLSTYHYHLAIYHQTIIICPSILTIWPSIYHLPIFIIIYSSIYLFIYHLPIRPHHYHPALHVPVCHYLTFYRYWTEACWTKIDSADATLTNTPPRE